MAHIPTSSRSRGKPLTKKERQAAKETFLKAFLLNGNIMLSCKQANIDRSTFYQWKKDDEEFATRYEEAQENFADFVLAEFRKRAMEGYEKPVISMGRLVYEEIPVLDPVTGEQLIDSRGKPMVKRGKLMTERVVSDTLLAMLIKRHFPEYREKAQMELTGKDGGPIKTQQVEVYKIRIPDNGRDSIPDTTMRA